MTPQERQLVDELFDRLASLENTRRDPDAERAIYEGFQRAPNAAYALVQSVLVQDEALKRANDRIRDLEAAVGAAPAEGGGFLDNMRDMLRGRDEPRGSVPQVRPDGLGSSGVWSAGPRPDGGAGPAQPWGQQAGGQPMAQQPPAPGFGGGSFLGTAASVAAGAIGGALLLNGIRSMMGGGHGGSHSAFDSAGGGSRSPWSDDSANSDLAREAGLSDIGGSSRAGLFSGDDRRAGLFGGDNDDSDSDVDDDIAGDFDGGGSDTA